MLPFAALRTSPEQRDLADGLTAELITRLGQIDSLAVIARTSAYAFRDSRSTIPDIAALLGVNWVVEGSLRADGESLRVTVGLVDARDGTERWTSTYTSGVSGLLAIEDRIAAVAIELAHRLAPHQERPPRNSEAHRHCLIGKHLFSQRTPQTLRLSMDRFREALKADPEYAPAWAGLASWLTFVSVFGGRPAEVMPQALDAASRAVAFDSGCAEAHASLAAVKANGIGLEPIITSSALWHSLLAR